MFQLEDRQAERKNSFLALYPIQALSGLVEEHHAGEGNLLDPQAPSQTHPDVWAPDINQMSGQPMAQVSGHQKLTIKEDDADAVVLGTAL